LEKTPQSARLPLTFDSWEITIDITYAMSDKSAGIYAHRAAGGDCHHCSFDRAIASRRAKGPRIRE
jgi:hypothetical protein